ncbi:MAG: ribonuclease [Cytophagia bacterium]|nr:ribonuclease [Cytophagia bacterium]
MKKIFILDTNVILHDYTCLQNFEENDIVIPNTVLEELDNFKSGNREINYNARRFLAQVDDLLINNSLSANTASLGKNKGTLTLSLNHKWEKRVKEFFTEDTPDHRIISCAYTIKKKSKFETIIVSKDSALRLKARVIGLESENYTHDQLINDPEKIFSGCRTISEVDSEIISNLYNSKKISLESMNTFIKNPIPNEQFVLKNGSASALINFNQNKKKYELINKKDAFGITARNAEQILAINLLLNKDLALTSIMGKAGTGKTLLALATALENKRHYRKIYIARPIIPLSNKDIGFLPGDIDDKIKPYMQPLYDNLNVIKHNLKDKKKIENFERLLNEKKIEVIPLAYIRGRSLHGVTIIVDEAQNLTPHEIKTVITRAGENTKIIFTGDVNQIDHPYLDIKSNGLTYLVERMKGQNIFGHITLNKGERSELSEIASELL